MLLSDSSPPWLRDVFALRARKGMDDRGRLLVEGLRCVAAALAACLPLERLLYTPEFFSGEPCREALVRAQTAGVTVHRVEPKLFSRLSYKAEGLIAVVRFQPGSLDEVVCARRVIVLDALSDPGNIGSILRSADAWDASVVVVGDASKLYHPKALRASMGAVFHTPTCAVTRAHAIERLAHRAVTVLTPHGGAHLGAAPCSSELVIVVGNEKHGVDLRWLEIATSLVAIPMSGAVDSLNVATAASIMLWESYRAR